MPASIPANQASANPGLKDLLDVLHTNVLLSVNCHAVATVNTVPVTNNNGLFTVNATMNYNRTYFIQQQNGTSVQTQNYPMLVDCPLIILGGGFTSLTFPVQPGDQCLILFNDRDLNNWFAGARSGPVASANLHSFSDAIALVGFPTVGNYSSTHAVLSNGNAEVGILNSPTGSQVRIANDLTTLGTALGSLTSILETLFTAMSAATPANVTATVGVPSGVAAAELVTVITELESLLE
jgi:hypothetical protein